MTMHLFCSGELVRQPEHKTSATGNPYVAAWMKVGVDTLVSLSAFDTTIAERLAGMSRGAALACSGRLRLSIYSKDGEQRVGINVTVAEIMVGAMPSIKAKPRSAKAAAGGLDQWAVYEGGAQ